MFDCVKWTCCLGRCLSRWGLITQPWPGGTTSLHSSLPVATQRLSPDCPAQCTGLRLARWCVSVESARHSSVSSPSETACSIHSHCRIHTIQKKHVAVNIQIEGTSEALDQRDCASAARCAGESRFFNQVRGSATVNNAKHPTHDRWTTGKQKAQRVREAQHPLAQES